MTDMNETADSLPQKKTIRHYLRKWYYGFLFWVYLYIWCRYCYSHVMKLMHKFNLHYTTVVMPYEKEDFNASILGDVRLKRKQLHCRWCGLRGDVLEYKTND